MQKSMKQGLIKTLGDMYNVLKGLVVKDPEMLGPYTRAYYDYFLNIDIQNGERLDDAILRSETFKDWLTAFSNRTDISDMDMSDLVTKFLDEVHLTSYDIKEIISGKEIWDNDNPDMEDESGEAFERNRHHLSLIHI